MSRFRFALPIVLVLVLVGCDSRPSAKGPAGTANASQEELSAEELINNPNTANPQEVVVPSDLGVITFAEKTFDFGDIHQGKVVSHSFDFTNTGQKPVIIDNASSSCGCTVPSYPREPVPPGGKGRIDVQFNSTGKAGMVSKTVLVRANTQPNLNEVTITANVLVP